MFYIHTLQPGQILSIAGMKPIPRCCFFTFFLQHKVDLLGLIHLYLQNIRMNGWRVWDIVLSHGGRGRVFLSCEIANPCNNLVKS